MPSVGLPGMKRSVVAGAESGEVISRVGASLSHGYAVVELKITPVGAASAVGVTKRALALVS